MEREKSTGTARLKRGTRKRAYIDIDKFRRAGDPNDTEVAKIETVAYLTAHTELPNTLVPDPNDLRSLQSHMPRTPMSVRWIEPMIRTKDCDTQAQRLRWAGPIAAW